MTMVFITHDLPEALRLGDRIAIMRDGAIVQLGTGEELVGSPADEYVANFVRDIPRSHVLTLRWIMRPLGPSEPADGARLPVTTTVRDAVPVLAESSRPCSPSTVTRSSASSTARPCCARSPARAS